MVSNYNLREGNVEYFVAVYEDGHKEKSPNLKVENGHLWLYYGAFEGSSEWWKPLPGSKVPDGFTGDLWDFAPDNPYGIH